MKRVLVGMSGGVDSAAAAYLLQKEGYEVCGVTLRTWDAGDGSESRCCEIDDAQRVAHRLGIRHYALNCVADFSGKVVDPFVRSYLEGQTPNPCIECNRYVKWEKMLYAAKVMEADYVATGHYAHVVRLANGRYTVKKARHAAKDQTYMLYKLSQEQLAATLMPLGDYTKEEVRRIALEAGLPVAQKPDSQEICFVTDGHYADFIEQYAEKRNREIVFDNVNSRLNEDSGRSAGSKEIGDNAGSKEIGDSAGSGAGGLKVPTRSGSARVSGSPSGTPSMSRRSGPIPTRSSCPTSPPCSAVKSCAGMSIFSRFPAWIRGSRSPQKQRSATITRQRMLCSKCRRTAVSAFCLIQSAVFYDADDCVIGGGIIVK